MKKQILLVMVLLLPFAFNQAFSQKSSAASDGLSGKIGISLYGGAGIPTNGDYSSSLKATDLLNVGPQFGLGVSYFFTPAIGIEVMGNYGFNYYKDDYKPAGKEPVLNNISVSLNGIYNFGSLLDGSPIAPFVRAGVGMYNWSHLDDGPGGDVLKSGNEDFSGSSFGFNVGLGCDFKIISNLSVGVVVDYNMYFPKDEDKFGADFGEQGYLSPQLKFSYYIPTK